MVGPRLRIRRISWEKWKTSSGRRPTLNTRLQWRRWWVCHALWSWLCHWLWNNWQHSQGMWKSRWPVDWENVKAKLSREVLWKSCKVIYQITTWVLLLRPMKYHPLRWYNCKLVQIQTFCFLNTGHHSYILGQKDMMGLLIVKKIIIPQRAQLQLIL